MRADISGVPHRIRFQHTMDFDVVPMPADAKARRRRTSDATPLEVRKVPKPFKVDLSPWPKFNRVPDARALTVCQILVPATGTPEEPIWHVVASAPAVCSWSEQSFDKEFARQLALARVVETLPRVIGAPLVGAYMESGSRTLRDLSAASRGRYSSLTDALPPKVTNA